MRECAKRGRERRKVSREGEKERKGPRGERKKAASEMAWGRKTNRNVWKHIIKSSLCKKEEN